MKAWHVALGALAAIGIGAGVYNRARVRAEGDSFRQPGTVALPKFTPITLIGDSFAIGMTAVLVPNAGIREQTDGLIGRAGSLVPLAAGRDILSYAKVGRFSKDMMVAPDDGTLVIVSAGSNDAAARPPDDAMVNSILRVLGPFAAGTAQKGWCFYHLPHAQMGPKNPTMAKNCAALTDRLMHTLNPTARFRFAPITVPANPYDFIHFDTAGYVKLDTIAIGAFS